MLVDNRAVGDLSAEHGFALWIRAGTERVLFDTGQGGALAKNARALGVDLSRTERLVLSHGHYDHTGGIPVVIAAVPAVSVYCHPGAAVFRYSVRNGEPKSIRIPDASLEALAGLPEQRFHPVENAVSLGKDVGCAAPIPRIETAEDPGGPFYLDARGKTPDPIEDDLVLWIRTPRGLVVCLGCGHAGLRNTLKHVLRQNPGTRIRAVIGGLHLVHADPVRIERTARYLKRLAPERVISCHCTGERAENALREALGPAFTQGAAGRTYVF